MSWTMSETMLNCDMPCSETQNASALARPGKALRMPGWPCFSHRISKLATCNSMGAPNWKRRERENQVPFHVLDKNTQYWKPGFGKATSPASKHEIWKRDKIWEVGKGILKLKNPWNRNRTNHSRNTEPENCWKKVFLVWPEYCACCNGL